MLLSTSESKNLMFEILKAAAIDEYSELEEVFKSITNLDSVLISWNRIFSYFILVAELKEQFITVKTVYPNLFLVKQIIKLQENKKIAIEEAIEEVVYDEPITFVSSNILNVMKYTEQSDTFTVRSFSIYTDNFSVYGSWEKLKNIKKICERFQNIYLNKYCQYEDEYLKGAFINRILFRYNGSILF